MFTPLLPYILLVSVFVCRSVCLCGDSIKWSHRINMTDVLGLWHGVGYAQHNPDRTNVPNEVGCISLYITDVDEHEYHWFDWSIQTNNYSSKHRRSSKSNAMPENSSERKKRKVKKSVGGAKRVRVLWDEDGHTLEKVYVYYEEEPGLWTEDQLGKLEKEMISRGIDVWHPDDPPRHPDVIRLIKLNQHVFILNHCSEVGNSGIFSLILHRSPITVKKWEWYKYQQQFYKFDLPNVHRFFAICAAGTEISSFIVVLICFISLFIL